MNITDSLLQLSQVQYMHIHGTSIKTKYLYTHRFLLNNFRPQSEMLQAISQKSAFFKLQVEAN